MAKAAALSAPAPSVLKTRECQLLLLSLIYAAAIVLGWEWEWQKEKGRVYEVDRPVQPSSVAVTRVTDSLSRCTKEASTRPKPGHITQRKYESVAEAERVLAFIMSKLDEIDAPLILIFGTMLHEVRNGTDGPCLIPDYDDKDFDVAVFPKHFRYITTFGDEIFAKFGWKFIMYKKGTKRVFTTLEPAHAARAEFHIDIYSFVCDLESRRILFPWDDITVAMNAFLPVQKHKLIFSQQGMHSGTNVTGGVGFYMPHNPPCLLSNIYGDWMTPRKGETAQAKWRTDTGFAAYDNPKCDSSLAPFEKYELERQLMFCSRMVPPKIGSQKALEISKNESEKSISLEQWRIARSEEVLSFLVSRLDEIDAPLTLMFGTMLREFRNAADGPCLRPDYSDKDFDLAVFPKHFHYVTSLDEEIQNKFGWEIHMNEKKKQRMFATISPIGLPANRRTGNYLQIDVYGFLCNKAYGLIFFPWDLVTVAMNAIIPVKRHRMILSQDENGCSAGKASNGSAVSNNGPVFYMPHDPPCLLHNIYGPDWRTPQTGSAAQAKWRTNEEGAAYDNPRCYPKLTSFDRAEIERQLAYCTLAVPKST